MSPLELVDDRFGELRAARPRASAELRAQIEAERLRAFTAFRTDVAQGQFPSDAESVALDPEVLTALREHENKG